MRRHLDAIRYPGRSRWRFVALLITAGAGTTFGCSDLTSVDTLDVAQISQFESRTGARTLRAGAIGSFTGAFAGSFSSQAIIAARVSDEWFYTNPTTAGDAYDHRNMGEIGGDGGFTLLSQARTALLQALDMMQRFDADATGDISELHSMVGYTHLWYGENWCSGVPVSRLVDGRIEHGEQLTTQQIQERALARFDSAAAIAGTNARAANFARVGRARTLLHLGRFADAAAAVAGVPTNFEFRLSYGVAVQQNNFHAWSYDVRQYTVPDREGVNGLDYLSANDPRVRTVLLPQPGLDGVMPVYAPMKYASADAPIVLASGVEARLIEAEALLRAGDANGALAKLNELRTTMPGLAPLTLQATEEARVDQIFRERAFWLFMTGQRFGDMRRLVRQYGRHAETVFPTGPASTTRSYGTAVTLGLPSGESINPNFTGRCLSRDA